MTTHSTELEAAIRDGLSNHSGEFLNPWLIKGTWTHEQLADVLDAVLSSERLKKNLSTLIADRERKARIEELEHISGPEYTSWVTWASDDGIDFETITVEERLAELQATKPEKGEEE